MLPKGTSALADDYGYMVGSSKNFDRFDIEALGTDAQKCANIKEIFYWKKKL